MQLKGDVAGLGPSRQDRHGSAVALDEHALKSAHQYVAVVLVGRPIEGRSPHGWEPKADGAPGRAVHSVRASLVAGPRFLDSPGNLKTFDFCYYRPQANKAELEKMATGEFSGIGKLMFATEPWLKD